LQEKKAAIMKQKTEELRRLFNLPETETVIQGNNKSFIFSWNSFPLFVSVSEFSLSNFRLFLFVWRNAWTTFHFSKLRVLSFQTSQSQRISSN
jgi:hypothetical protein